MIRRDFLKTVGAVAATGVLLETDGGAQTARPTPSRKFDLHTHYYPKAFFQKIRDLPSEFSFDKSPTGQTVIKYRGA
ncbi:MAG: twin-arginine translocation signal domain-containing protein, partial [Gammaproteobacteria bacterium]